MAMTILPVPPSRPSSLTGDAAALWPNLTTRERWKRLVAVGMENCTWTLADLWDWVHEHYEEVFVFDSSGSTEDLIEALVSIIEKQEGGK